MSEAGSPAPSDAGGESIVVRPSGTLGWWVSGVLLLGLVQVLALVGWPHERVVEETLLAGLRVTAGAYGILYLWFWVRVLRRTEERGRMRWVAPALAVMIVLSAIFEEALALWLAREIAHVPLRMVLLGFAALQQLTAFFLRLASLVSVMDGGWLRRLNPGTILCGTFVVLSLSGTLLLRMPNATTDGIGWVDALFTSTSAVCVTGLIVVDTATAFTPVGQAIILMLIQLGAFGIVTLTFFLAVVTGQGFSVTSRVFLKDVLNLENLRNLGSAILFVIGFTLVVEAIGWFVLYRLWGAAGSSIENPGWVALFHSVSAFCNAGFSLFSSGLMDPRAVGNVPVQAVIMVLILLGGIGFPVLLEVAGMVRRRPLAAYPGPRRFSIHARLTLITTAILLSAGTLLLFLGEAARNPAAELLSTLWTALFNSVTARTAGFNISDMAALSSAATAVMILLMFIGGSPGGFAGGIKTTTFALSMLNLRRILLAHHDVEIFERRVDESLCYRAFAVLLLSVMWIFAATSAILFLHPQFLLLDTLFEVVSAFSTVGLSRGLTAELSLPGKWIIIATMLVGRVGVMNFFFSLLVLAPRERKLRMPRERIIIE